jgi:uncharacterized protein YqeY
VIKYINIKNIILNNMSIQEQIKEDMKQAMKDKDAVKLSVTRGILSSFTNELVASGKTPQDSIDDEMAMAVINRAAKQRKDSIEQFEKGGRAELAEDEKKELEIIQQYLPELMSEEEVKKIVETKKEELGINDKSGMGQLMGAVMAELKGKADGSIVKQAVDEILN